MALEMVITVFIYLLSNGSLVSMNVTTTQSTALLNVTLPVRPFGPIIVQNSSGSTIPAILMGNRLVIPAFGSGSFIINYVPYIAQSPSGYLIINVSSPYTINLFVGDNVLIAQLPMSLITNFTRVSNGVIIQLAPGNYSIGFIPESTGITTGGATAKATGMNSTSATAMQTTVGTTKSPPGLGPIPYYVVSVVVVAVAAVLAYLLLVRHRGVDVNPVIIEGLNPTDREVLRALIDMGGEAYQADLQRRLNMPKATLWRAIKRLEGFGYVQVVKEGRVNKIKLIKKPKLD